MLDNFEQLIATLQDALPNNDVLCEIKHILEQQNAELCPTFLSTCYQPLITLKDWTWQVFSQSSRAWTRNTTYLELCHAVACFHKRLIFNYDHIEGGVKCSLLVPSSMDKVNLVFENLEKTSNENDIYITIVSLWFDNLSFFLHDYPEFESDTFYSSASRYIALNYVMTGQYKSYLNQLREISIPTSIYTAQQSFYIKTCSSFLSSYFFSKAHDFIYTPEELVRHFGFDHARIILLHTFTMKTWSSSLLSCIAHLLNFFSACCWWGGEKGLQARIIFPTESESCEYFDALIRTLEHKPLHEHIAPQRSNDETVLVDATLFSLMNISQNQHFLWFLRSKKTLPDILLAITKISTYDKICLYVYGILAEVLSDQRLKELHISDSVSKVFFYMLEQAWQRPSKKFKQIPIFFLLKFFRNLSKIDAIQQKTADSNKVLLFIEMCEAYPVIYDILWALSFNLDIQEQLRSNTAFMTKLGHLTKEIDDPKARKITYGLLWNLEMKHETRSISPSNNEKPFEIMISYSHRDQIICRKVYEQLNNAGFNVWIDFDQIHGNVMDAMAQAIEQSNTILICMTEEYRRSNYCRAEANYAFQRGNRIVPILLQEHYKPDGWLLFLVGQLVYVDFTRQEFSQALEMLVKELKAPIIREVCVVDTDSHEEVDITSLSTPRTSSASLPESMSEWTTTHVQDWLVSHDLLQMSRLFTNLDGQGLIYINEAIENVELQQIISLLQEDSMRRTNQSLSLVEFSYFRSLMNQHKRNFRHQTPPPKLCKC